MNEPNIEQMKNLWQTVQFWIDKLNIHAAEDIYQMDNVAENAPYILEDICDIVGYKELK